MLLIRDFLTKKKIKEQGLGHLKILSVSFAGVLAGFQLGHTALGQYLPGLISVGFLACTTLAVLFALGLKPRRPALRGMKYFLLVVLVCSIVLGSSISAGCLYAEDDWHYRLAGYLPYSDASAYFGQATSWPDASFNVMASFHTLSSIFHIALYRLGGCSLLGMYLAAATLAAMAIAAFTESLGTLVGRYTSWAAACLLLYWSWPYASMVMTELSGVTLSAAGFALIFRGLQAPADKSRLAWGLSGYTLANVCRPFNPLSQVAFALLLAEKTLVFKSRLAAGFTMALITMLIYLGVSAMTFGIYGNPVAKSKGNASAILLGMARGTNYSEAVAHTIDSYPEVTAGIPDERKHRVSILKKEVNEKMAEIFWPTVRENPRVFIRSLVRGLKASLEGLYYKTVRAMGLEWPATRFWAAGITLFYLGISLAMMLLFRSRVVLVTLLSFLSFFTIAPVLYNDVDWRGAASLYPGLSLVAILIPMTTSHLRKLLLWSQVTTSAEGNQPAGDEPAGVITAKALIVLALLTIPYPWLLRETSPAHGNGGHHHAFTLAIDSARQPGWTGFNSAVIRPERLGRWFAKGGEMNLAGLKENAAFVEKHGERLQAIVCEGSGFTLVFKDSIALRAFPDQSGICPTCATYKLSVRQGRTSSE